MRIRRQPAARRQLAAKVRELLLGEPSLEEGARVDSRRRVPLGVHLVAAVLGIRAAEEVIERDLEQCRRGGKGGDVPADALLGGLA